MRVYFIFQIKEEFKNMYNGRESNLYQILKSIYRLSSSEVVYGYNLLRQVTIPLDKELLDRDLFVKLHAEYPYSKRDDIHYYNQLYKNEISRLIIKKGYMRLEAEQDNSTFFDILKQYSDSFFVCDFNKLKFFFL